MTTGTASEAVVANQVSESESPSARASLYLHPGHIFVSTEPTVVKTILGSCVSVCLYDPVLRGGGMNHYLLPFGDVEGLSPARFGNVAIKILISKLSELGSKKSNLQAKIFGGACVLDAFRQRGDHLGLKNIEMARRILADEQIPVVSEDVGENHGRKLIFHVDEGIVMVKRL